MQAPCVDIYVLAPERSAKAFQAFADRWLKDFVSPASEWEVYLEDSDEIVTITVADDLIAMMIVNPNLQPNFGMYWRAARRDEEIGYGMLFFGDDSTREFIRAVEESNLPEAHATHAPLGTGPADTLDRHAGGLDRVRMKGLPGGAETPPDLAPAHQTFWREI
jgi:hypothetical protein